MELEGPHQFDMPIILSVYRIGHRHALPPLAVDPRLEIRYHMVLLGAVYYLLTWQPDFLAIVEEHRSFRRDNHIATGVKNWPRMDVIVSHENH